MEHVSFWPAPHVDVPVHATVTLPGSKSITNRALILAALADGPSTLSGALRSRDTNLMIAALSALGAVVAGGGGEAHRQLESRDAYGKDT